MLPDCVRKEETNEKINMYLLQFKKKKKAVVGLVTVVTKKSVLLAGCEGRGMGVWW